MGKVLIDEDFRFARLMRICANHVTGRLNREIRRRTDSAGIFPAGGAAFMPVYACLTHGAGAPMEA